MLGIFTASSNVMYVVALMVVFFCFKAPGWDRSNSKGRARACLASVSRGAGTMHPPATPPGRATRQCFVAVVVGRSPSAPPWLHGNCPAWADGKEAPAACPPAPGLRGSPKYENQSVTHVCLIQGDIVTQTVIYWGDPSMLGRCIAFSETRNKCCARESAPELSSWIFWVLRDH